MPLEPGYSAQTRETGGRVASTAQASEIGWGRGAGRDGQIKGWKDADSSEMLAGWIACFCEIDSLASA